MELAGVHQQIWNLPKNKIKRIIKAAEREVVHNKRQPYNYYVWFSVDGLRVYASLSPIVESNECMIFPSEDGTDFDGSTELYVARRLRLSKDSLLFCINEWLESIYVRTADVLNTDFNPECNLTYIKNMYEDARKRFPCDCKQIIPIRDMKHLEGQENEQNN